MKRSWVLPAVILVVLLLAWSFQWQTVATKTTDDYVQKWQLNRWTGTVYFEKYNVLGGAVSRTSKGSQFDRGLLTGDLGPLIIVVSVWLLYNGWISPWRKERKARKALGKAERGERV